MNHGFAPRLAPFRHAELCAQGRHHRPEVNQLRGPQPRRGGVQMPQRPALSGPWRRLLPTANPAPKWPGRAPQGHPSDPETRPPVAGSQTRKKIWVARKGLATQVSPVTKVRAPGRPWKASRLVSPPCPKDRLSPPRQESTATSGPPRRLLHPKGPPSQAERRRTKPDPPSRWTAAPPRPGSWVMMPHSPHSLRMHQSHLKSRSRTEKSHCSRGKTSDPSTPSKKEKKKSPEG